jgi:hypothetical protein
VSSQLPNLWIVTEAVGYNPVTTNSFVCESEDSAIELFCKLVSEYGVEPYEEMIDEHEFVAEDYCVFFNPAAFYKNGEVTYNRS